VASWIFSEVGKFFSFYWCQFLFLINFGACPRVVAFLHCNQRRILTPAIHRGLAENLSAFGVFVQTRRVALRSEAGKWQKQIHKLQARLQEGKTQRNRTLENPMDGLSPAPNVRKLVDDVLKSERALKRTVSFQLTTLYNELVGRHAARETGRSCNELRLQRFSTRPRLHSR